MEFVLALHSHLPWVLNHGRWPHGSDWLCEAALDTYLPLLERLEELAAEGTPTPLTIGFDVAMYHALGIEGVALATAVSLTVQNVVQMFVVRRVAGFSTLADLRAAVGEGRQLLDRVARRT